MITIILVVYHSDKKKLKSVIKKLGSKYKIIIIDNSTNYNFKDIELNNKTKIIRSVNIGNGGGINIGLKNGNFRVIDLAIKVLRELKNIKIEIINSHNKDQRTYKVSFHRIYKLCGKNIIKISAEEGIHELIKFFKKNKINKKTLIRKTTRLDQLNYLISSKKLNKNLENNNK